MSLVLLTLLTCSIRAVVTSILHREVLLYPFTYQFIYSVINGSNEITRRDHSFVHIYIHHDSYFIYTIYNNILIYHPLIIHIILYIENQFELNQQFEIIKLSYLYNLII